MDKRSVRRGVVVIDELESNFGKFVYLGDSYTPSDEDDDNSDEEEGSEEIEPYGPELVKKCTKKCAESDDEPETSMKLLFSEDQMKPKLPLVSAMKGSREKLEASPRELSVSWAPHVYDPIPDSLSRTVKTKQKSSRKDKDRDKEINNYKNKGKKGQKGNCRGKDKQLGKAGGRRSDRGCNRNQYTWDTPDEF
ncbi:unnamed protein product [Cuscuta epithymum]|uniref:Uncharacterized protein n=2 Tax=Cuscuta epithymum TaxID=186058 RepID=A0AAV0FFJ5_9ASTE|nr:unnamed protein product [Cuscuta epithymum]